MDAPPNDGQHPLPTTAADARREALTQALLEVLTERRAHSSDTESEISTFSDWAFCAAQLAEYIEQTNRELDTLKECITRLEALLRS